MKTDKILSSKTIGERVKFRRQDIGMSQERLAEILGVSFQQIQRYEAGANRISVERIQQIAIAMSVPIIYFFENGPAMSIVSEPPEYYAYAGDERILLRHFKRISSKAARQFVITAARLAVKKS